MPRCPVCAGIRWRRQTQAEVAMNEGEKPCRTCGTPVRIVKERGEMSITDTTAPIVLCRVCTNDECRTNGLAGN